MKAWLASYTRAWIATSSPQGALHRQRASCGTKPLTGAWTPAPPTNSATQSTSEPSCYESTGPAKISPMGCVGIDATRPVADVVDEILRRVEGEANAANPVT